MKSIFYVPFSYLLLFLYLVQLCFISLPVCIATSSLTWNFDINYKFGIYIPVVLIGQDHFIYAFGGEDDSNGPVSSSYKFNISAGSPREWIEIESMLTPVYDATGCVANDGGFFIFGGGANLQIYNRTDGNWSNPNPNMPSGASINDYHMSCAVDSSSGLMYITGGENVGNRFYSYNVSSNTITDLSSSLVPFNLHAQGSFVANNGELYVFGGYDSTSDYVASTYIYDIARNIWSKGNNMKEALGWFGYATDGIRFYAIGGVNSTNNFEYTQVYNISSGVWSIDDGLLYPGGIYGNSALFLDGSLHSIGGYDGSYLSLHLIASLCGVYAFNGPCDDLGQCILNGTCQINGNCIGTCISSSDCNCTSVTSSTTTSVTSSTTTSITSSSISSSTFSTNFLTTSSQIPSTSSISVTSITSPNSFSSNTTDSSSSSSISASVVAVIVITVLALVIIVVAILFLLKHKRKRKSEQFADISLLTSRKTKAIGKYRKINAVQILEKIGGGNFGEVYYGKWNGTTEVALKQLKASEHFEEFVQEASMLQSLNHPNIVRFFGIHTTSNGEHFLVMEYMRKGSLDGVLQTEKNQIFLLDLLSMTKDAASGMVYLHEQGIVHRDLALRNLLVTQSDKPGTKYIVKISDFGMARTMDKGYYKTENKTIPVRWCSPEAINFGKFTIHSDVWAFGVVMWEIFSYGMIPYYGMSNAEVVEKVITEGLRLPSPTNCPRDIYQWMLDCWNEESERRPNFKDLYDRIEKKWVELLQNYPRRNPNGIPRNNVFPVPIYTV